MFYDIYMLSGAQVQFWLSITNWAEATIVPKTEVKYRILKLLPGN